MSVRQKLGESTFHVLSMFFAPLGGLVGVVWFLMQGGLISIPAGVAIGLFVALAIAYSNVRSERAAALKRIADLEAQFNERREFKVDVPPIGSRCLVAWSSDPKETDFWVVITNVVVTNLTEGRLPLDCWLMFGSRSGWRRLERVLSAPPPPWALEQMRDRLVGQNPLMNPLTLDGRASSQTSFISVRLSDRFLEPLGYESARDICARVPIWLQIRNNFAKQGTSIEFALTNEARRHDLARRGIGLRTTPALPVTGGWVEHPGNVNKDEV